MTPNFPYIFGAGDREPPPAPSSHPQYHTQASSTSQSQQQGGISTSQQAAFLQNAQASGMDLSALEGISPHQLAAIARLFQTGALLPAPSELPGTAPANASDAAQSQSTKSQAPQASRFPGQEQDVDMDRDEGEIDESEAETAKPQRGFLRPPPTGPRNPNVKQRGPQMSERKSSPRPSLLDKADAKRRGAVLQQVQPQQANEIAKDKPQDTKDIEAKTFVLQLLKAGYSFEDLVKETGNPKALTRLFTQMRLEVPSTYSLVSPTHANGTITAKLPTKRPVSARPTAPAKPLDRSEYLARLQAAKNKKADTGVNAKDVDMRDATLVPASTPMEGVAASPANEDATKAKQKIQDKTALARQRLEALKASQAAKQSAPPQSATQTSNSSLVKQSELSVSNTGRRASSPLHAGLGAGLDGIPAKASQMSSSGLPKRPPITTHYTDDAVPRQMPTSPAPPAPSRSLSGLPGLSMFNQNEGPQLSAVERSHPTASVPRPGSLSTIPSMPTQSGPQNLTSSKLPTKGVQIPRKRPVAADFETDIAPTKPKRPFGLSRGTTAEESVIITISDDEDDDADDEMDTDNAEASTSKTPTTSFRDAAPLRDFPARPVFQKQSSGQSTPGASTPSGMTYEQRMKDIEDMKRKIAEAEKRKNTNGRPFSVPRTEPLSIANQSGGSSPTPRVSSGSTPKVVDVPLALESSTDGLMHAESPVQSSQQLEKPSSEENASAVTMARHQEKERLRERLRKLEQNEFKDIDDAVQAAIDEPEPMNGSQYPSSTQQALGSPDDTGLVPNASVPAVANEPSAESEGDEGDDSGSDFYSATDAEGQAHEPIVENDTKMQPQPFTTLDEVGIVQLPGFHSPIATEQSKVLQSPAEVHLPTSNPQDSAMYEAVETNAGEDEGADEHDSDRMSEDSDSISGSDSDSDEGEDEDEGDLDSALQDRQADEASNPQPPTNGDTHAISVNLASTAASDNYEPASPMPVEAAPEARDQVSQSATPLAVSGARTTKPVNNDAPDDDLAPELQPEPHLETQEQSASRPASRFKPYQSALRGFKDYKWHPEFPSTASQGFRSLTFNHNIDADKPLCPFEGSGGQCNDPHCEYQHFKDMGLSDEEFVERLGVNPLPHSEADQKRWDEGIEAVIARLRSQNLSTDLDAAARAMAELRREILGDSTKVLTPW